MNRLLRTFLMLPALMIALIALPTLFLSASQSNEQNFFAELLKFNAPQVALAQGTSPLPTPTSTTAPLPTNTPVVLPTNTPTGGGTIPVPTATRRPPIVHPTATKYYRPVRPHKPAATATATPKPTVTATATQKPILPSEEAFIKSSRIEKVIGDRLSSTIYAYTEEGWLYRSDDDGTVWMLVSTTPKVDDFVMNAQNPDILYGSDGIDCSTGENTNSIYKSVDGGIIWIEVPASEGKLPLLSNPGDPNNLFAASCDMLFLTTDGGFTWVAKPDSSSDALWETYRVIDMAASSLVGDPTPNVANWNQLYAGGVDGEGTGVVAFSNDLGDTWVRLTPNINPAPWSMSAVTADPFIEGLVAFAEPRSVWFTENFGVNWQVTTKGLNNVLDRGIDGAPFGLHDVVYHPNGDLYLATARGLYMKPASATTWSKVEDTDFDLAEITEILFTETNADVLWLNSDDGVFTYDID